MVEFCEQVVVIRREILDGCWVFAVGYQGRLIARTKAGRNGSEAFLHLLAGLLAEIVVDKNNGREGERVGSATEYPLLDSVDEDPKLLPPEVAHDQAIAIFDRDGNQNL